ncbi:MAG: hypothetical protein ACPLPR_08500 [Bacillota bacterium]
MQWARTPRKVKLLCIERSEDAFRDPTSSLELHKRGFDLKQLQPWDFAETFNRLYGLRVKGMCTWHLDGRTYFVVKATQIKTGARLARGDCGFGGMPGALMCPRKGLSWNPSAGRCLEAGETWDEILINGVNQCLNPLFSEMLAGTE